MSDICILICKSFELELQEVVKDFDNVDVKSYKSKCKYHHIKEGFNADIVEQYKKTLLVGGCTLDSDNLPEGVELFKKENCFYMFAPKNVVDSYINEGGYIITPGWLSKWKEYVTGFWGFDQIGATAFFKEFCKKLVLLDTKVDPQAKKNLEEFAEFVEQPYEVLEIGLDQFSLFIENIINKTQNSIDNSENINKLKEANKSAATHEMAFDLISRLNQKLEENEIIDNIKEVFTMLYAPENLYYYPCKDNKIDENLEELEIDRDELDQILATSDNYLMKEKGFIVKLNYGDELLGIVNVDNIAFVEYKTAYLNLAISISGVCALAIANARNLLKTQEIEAQLAQHAKLVAMGEMMGAIAHQWRQPLNELNINIEMLEEYYDCGEIDEGFIENFISKNTETLRYLSKTITDFSDFFRIDKLKSGFSIKDKVNETLDIMSTQLKNHNIFVEIHGDDIEVFGLPNEFQQVILNLISNAKDAIIESGIDKGKIDIGLSLQDQIATLTIADNGGGISDEIIDRIYEPYFTTKEQGKGIGMGLYISKMIIEENMNGKLYAQNKDEGAEFIIELEMGND